MVQLSRRSFVRRGALACASVAAAAGAAALAGCGAEVDELGRTPDEVRTASREQVAMTEPDPWDLAFDDAEKTGAHVKTGAADAGAVGAADGAARPAASAPSASPYKDGTYTGTGLGMDGRIMVTLRIEDGVIACTSMEQDGETPGVGGFEAIRDGVYARMIDAAQGSDIDTVAGATITTAGVRLAVDDALDQAKA